MVENNWRKKEARETERLTIENINQIKTAFFTACTTILGHFITILNFRTRERNKAMHLLLRRF